VDETSEGGRLSRGVKRTADLLKSHEWRTIGEMAAKDEAFADAKRNKGGSYINSFSRSLLGEELRTLFDRQREFGSSHASKDIEAQVWEQFVAQRPALTGKAMLEMIGRCTFERDEYRAPKRSFSVERFIWLSKLNNIKVIEAGHRRALTAEERRLAKDLPYRLSKVTWKQLRKAIDLPEAPSAGFAGLSYGSRRNRKGEPVDPEETILVELKGWHAMRKELDADATRSAWERLSGAALAGDPGLFDAIAQALSIYKSDAELEPELVRLGLGSAEVAAILRIDYGQFIQLSAKAIAKLMPHLESGMRYDEACAAAGYNHARPVADGTGARLLPRFESGEIRNPVVFRSLNQARKVLNALVEQYGAPVAVHVELARDLSRSYEDRKDVERGQKEFQVEKQAAVDYFVEQIGRHPKRDELLKLRLYREQDGQCAYSRQPLAPDGDIRTIFESGSTQIDHILPYSRSFDDSLNNKVLVRSVENQNKGNRTPFEYLGGASESEAWRAFEAWVRGHKIFRKAKRDRLLRENFGGEESTEFKERNLSDTRYVTKLFADRVRHRLAFAPDEDGTLRKPENRVLCPAGGFTAFLRARWGLVKNRGASDLHHALDACVIAAASRTLQKRVSDFSRRKELTQLPNGTFVDAETGELLLPEAANALGERFPQPWIQFRDEVVARLSEDPRSAIPENHPGYDEAARASLKPVLVSRAVKRRARGAIHEDTIRSTARHLGPNTSAKRVRLESLKLTDLPDIVGFGDARNSGLLATLKERLEAHGGDGKKAFGPAAPPVHKPRRDGTPGPLIRAVKVKSVQKGGVRVRGGVADQASMWRVDLFEKGGKYYTVPIYQADRHRNAALPNRAVLAYKARNDWTPLDESYRFCFSLHPNDYIRLEVGGSKYYGYFSGLDVSTAAISILAHDRNSEIGKNGVWRGLGVKLGVGLLEKYHVDVLGNLYRSRPEVRSGLA